MGVKDVLSLWCLSALLFGPFAGQQKRGLRVGVLFKLQTRPTTKHNPFSRDW